MKGPLTSPEIERAIDGLLNAILDHEARERASRTAPSRFEVISLADLRAEHLPTRVESDVRQLARDPVGAACRQGIRTCGERLFALSGDTTLMHEAIEHVADLDAAHYGARLTIVDCAWNGIGGSWWS